MKIKFAILTDETSGSQEHSMFLKEPRLSFTQFQHFYHLNLIECP